MDKCKSCIKWQEEQKASFIRCESIFEVASEMDNFEQSCVKTCPYMKESTENS